MMLRPWSLAFTCFLLGFCSLSYEFMLAQLISLLEGHTVFYYGMTIGIYVFGLGMGSLAKVPALDVESCVARLVNLELLLATLGGSSPLLLAYSQRWTSFQQQGSWSILPPVILIFTIAWLSGRELPWLLRIAEIQGQKSWMTRLIAMDYIASFVGALAFPLWVFPRFGIVSAGILLGLINLSAVFLLLNSRSRTWLLCKTAAAILLGLWLWSYSETMSQQLSRSLTEHHP